MSNNFIFLVCHIDDWRDAAIPKTQCIIDKKVLGGCYGHGCLDLDGCADYR